VKTITGSTDKFADLALQAGKKKWHYEGSIGHK